MQDTKSFFLIQVWEQEFAWTAADKPIKVAARARTVPGDHKLNKQPIFCFETMMHMLYWSSLVCDYKRVCSCLHGRCPHRVNEDAALTQPTLAPDPPLSPCLSSPPPLIVPLTVDVHACLLGSNLQLIDDDSGPAHTTGCESMLSKWTTALFRWSKPSLCFEMPCNAHQQSLNLCMQSSSQLQRSSRQSRQSSSSSQGMTAVEQQPSKTTLNLQTAMGLYNLTDSELFWEIQLNTRCLIGWNEHTIVIAFRGTASMKNALSDVQVCTMCVCVSSHLRVCLSVRQSVAAG